MHTSVGMSASAAVLKTLSKASNCSEWEVVASSTNPSIWE